MAQLCDVAQYIRNRYFSLTKIKLQKILYYAQAWTLAWDNRSLFEDDFYAWDYGPLLVDFNNSLPENDGLVVPEIEGADISRLAESDIENINIVLDTYGDKDTEWLVDLTHREDPWKNTRMHNIIEKAVIQTYYKSLCHESA